MNGVPPPLNPLTTYSRKASKRRQRAHHLSDDDSDHSQRRSKVRLEATNPISSSTLSDTTKQQQGIDTRFIPHFSSRSHVDEKAAKFNARMVMTFSFVFVLSNSLRQSMVIPLPCPRNTHNASVVREAGPLARGQAAHLPIH